MATIQKRGTSYKITVSSGYDLSGKQIRHTMTWSPPDGMTKKQIQKEVNRQAVLFEEKVRTGQVLDGNIKFADFAELWFKDYADKCLRPTTVARYHLLMPRINAAIGHIHLDKLQPHHIMSLYDSLSESGIREDGRYQSAIDFKQFLKSRHMTKRELSKQASVSLYVLNSLTRGDHISAASASKISSALHMPLAKLFTPVPGKDKLSVTTILHHHRLLSSILSTAVKWQVIFDNPCRRVTLPKNKRKEAAFLDEDQALRMLDALSSESIQHQAIVKLLLFTGMRRAELCGLQWSDVDWEHSMLYIRRSSLYLSGKGVFKDETKNETSQRCIKISADLLDILRLHRAEQNKRRLQLGNRWQESERIFTGQFGAPIRPDVITAWVHKFTSRLGMPEIHTHSLRHTNASLLIAAGTNLPTVAKRLGHADTTTTSRIYAHAIKSADEAAADTPQDILHSSRKQA